MIHLYELLVVEVFFGIRVENQSSFSIVETALSAISPLWIEDTSLEMFEHLAEEFEKVSANHHNVLIRQKLISSSLFSFVFDFNEALLKLGL